MAHRESGVRRSTSKVGATPRPAAEPATKPLLVRPAVQTNEPAIRLEWPGKGVERPLPVADLEIVRRGRAGIRLVVGDNLSALVALRERKTRAMLVYLDPPFFTGREHDHVARERTANGVRRTLVPAFDDRWKSLDQYLAALYDRIRAAYPDAEAANRKMVEKEETAAA